MWRGLWFRYLRLTGSAHSELWNGSVFLMDFLACKRSLLLPAVNQHARWLHLVKGISF